MTYPAMEPQGRTAAPSSRRRRRPWLAPAILAAVVVGLMLAGLIAVDQWFDNPSAPVSAPAAPAAPSEQTTNRILGLALLVLACTAYAWRKIRKAAGA